MDLQTIERLWEKFYNGETTLDEELQLGDYFNNHEVPAHFKHEQEQFKYYKTARQDIITNAEFDENVLQAIEHLPAKGNVRNINRYIYYSVAVAASFALLIGIYFSINNINNGDLAEMQNTYEDPKQAYIETKKALMLVSEKFNLGTRNINKIAKFHQAQELITYKNK